MRTFLVVSSVCLILGCNSGGNPPVDAGGDAGGGGGDVGVRDAGGGDAGGDAGVGDAGVVADGGTDAAAASCATVRCSADHACVRGVCVPTCGADTSTFDAALAGGLAVVGSVCRTPTALTYAGGQMYELTASTSGLVTTFTLQRWTPGTETPAATTIATATYTAAAAGTMVFAGGYVAVAPDQMHAVFGYTTTLAGIVGGVFDVATGTGTATELPANGNYDAAFADGTHYLVNGALGGAQGVYRATSGGTSLAQVVSHVGDASGSVVFWGDEGLVLAGGIAFATAWPDGATTGERVLVLDAAALASASAPIDGSTVPQLTMPSTFEMLPGARVASVHYDATYAVDAIQVRTLTRATGGGAVSVSSPTNLTTGSTFTSITAAGSDVALGFSGGLLFVH